MKTNDLKRELMRTMGDCIDECDSSIEMDQAVLHFFGDTEDGNGKYFRVTLTETTEDEYFTPYDPDKLMIEVNQEPSDQWTPEELERIAARGCEPYRFNRIDELQASIDMPMHKGAPPFDHDNFGVVAIDTKTNQEEVKRKLIIVIENDGIGDGVWNKSVTKSMQEFVDHFAKTEGSGNFPQTFETGRGDKITVHVPDDDFQAAVINPNESLTIEQHGDDTVTIEGTRYDNSLFKLLGCDFPSMVGQVLKIEKRDNGVITTSDVSDEHHTMDEVYNHRCHLFVALMRSNPEISWRSKSHYDGKGQPDWFIAGMHLPCGDITYHLPQWMWSMLDCLVKTMDRAPEWDGHTPDDVVKRLADWFGLSPKGGNEARPRRTAMIIAGEFKEELHECPTANCMMEHGARIEAYICPETAGEAGWMYMDGKYYCPKCNGLRG